MKAIVQDRYGNPEAVLGLQEIAKPAVKDGEALVRVHAASIHVGDWLVVTGLPYIARPAYGKPKGRVPGTDIAGTVEAVGNGVTGLRPGDEVFGWCTGAFAEYASAPADHFVPKPTSLTFEQAAAVGVSASTALQLLRDQGKIKPGQKVLINGASGGIGTFAVQIAKTFGAEVTGVCSTRNVEMVRSIGADHVIDYTREDFTRNGHRFDFILDNMANHSLSDTRRVLTPSGKLQSNNGTSGGRWFGTIGTVLKSATVSMFERRQLGPAIKFTNRADLLVLKELIEAGKITPVIDATYALSDTGRGLAHVGEGHARGTVVISV
ncbi:MAG: NAD(P)-dependent alcohol dehydrogenase [Chloroflexi bacterium]|nr:MAG: NAD(P)-dependent alcohol dehydrogenase [Chloroflexota bacterium]TMG67925.1 MAG: NAD(P)-dependent alcohol dehydrogenase [Chloroflexota bacterium]